MFQPRKIILFSILLLSNLWGQWTNLNPVQNASNLNSITFVERGFGWVVGEDGVLLKSTNDGESWLAINLNCENELNKVFFFDSENGWIVGKDGIILKTSDAGNNWQEQSFEFATNFNSIDFYDLNNGVIVGEDGTILLTKDGGIKWDSKSNPSTTDLFDVKYVDPLNICVTGIDSNILYSEDGGNSWKKSVIDWQEIPYSGNSSSLCFVSDTVGWMVIGYHILRTTNKGKSWKRTNDLFWWDSIQFYTLFFPDEEHGFIGGQRDNLSNKSKSDNFAGRNSGMGAILKTSDGGENWEIDDSFVLEKVNSIAFSASKEIFTACNAGTLIYNNVKLGWTTSLSGQTQNMQSISFINETHGWVTAKYYRLWADHCLIYKTVDGGNAWSPLYDFSWVIPTKIFFLNEKQGWISRSNGDILLTTDGGEEWQEIDLPLSTGLNDIIFVAEKDGWAAGNEGAIIKTTDGGFNWYPQETGAINDLYSIHFINLKNGFAVGEGGIILHSIDSGENWTNIYNASFRLNSITFIDEYFGWAVGENGAIIKTTDNGTSWQSQISGTNADLFSISFYNKFIGKAVGEEGTMLSTIDGGDTWLIEQSSSNQNLNEIQYIRADAAYAAGNGGTILKYNGMATTGIETNLENSDLVPLQFELHQNFPNPFNPSTNILFSLLREERVVIKVFNLLGKEVVTLLNENRPVGTHSITFDASAYASGVYIYQIQAGEFSNSKKMILIK